VDNDRRQELRHSVQQIFPSRLVIIRFFVI